MGSEGGLNAGTFTLSGPFAGSPEQISPPEAGLYYLPLGNNVLTPGTWTLSSSGGADVGPFTSSIQIPSGPFYSP